MIAIYLSPIYLLLNLYILRWAYLWMGTCHSILRTLGFRLIFAVIYVLLSTSLLTGFLIKNPKSLHRMLKITGNYFLGIFLYTLVIILLADFGRILLCGCILSEYSPYHCGTDGQLPLHLPLHPAKSVLQLFPFHHFRSPCRFFHAYHIPALSGD